MLKLIRYTLALALIVAALTSVSYAGGPPPNAPELDPGSMMSALTLLTGGLVLVGRRRTAK